MLLDAAREDAGRAVRESNGNWAVCNAISGWRNVFAIAIEDRHLANGLNPALEVKKPTLKESSRRPLTERQMNEMWDTVKNGGDDPILDALVANFIVITGARREGVIGLNVRDVGPATCMVWLDEKNDKREEQPVPDWFARLLLEFAESRGSTRPGDPVFRYAEGRRSGSLDASPLTRISGRRFGTLFDRIKASAEWADQMGLSGPGLWHHGHALIERGAEK